MKLINEQINPRFLQQAKMLSKYTALLREILPPECLAHVEVANIRNQSLMLIADSPVWATRLRQLSPQILQALTKPDSSKLFSHSEAAARIHHVQVSTRYKHSRHSAADQNTTGAGANQVPDRQAPEISKRTAELLSQSASSINYQPLKTALLKLASHAPGRVASKPACADDITGKNKT